MFLLALSLAALAVGPLVYRVADRAREGLAALDGFVMTAIAGLVLVHIVPHAVEAAGVAAVAVAIAGFLGPGFIERALRGAAHRVHSATLSLAVGGLLLHGFFDGVGLATPDGHSDGVSLLAIAVLLHRLPIGITLWWLLHPRTGPLRSALVLVGLGLATAAGFASADAFSSTMDAAWLGLVQALIAGSLLHVVIHRPAPVTVPKSESRDRLFAGLGALAGIVAVTALASQHLSEFGAIGTGFSKVFVTLVLESAPALVLAFALAGLVQVFLPALPLRWLRTGGSVTEASRGVAFGLPLPICSCGVVPLYKSLIEQRVPATAAMAFLVATPELGLDAILISLPLLGTEMAVLRVAAAFGVALLVGIVVGRMADRLRTDLPSASAREDARHRESWLERLRGGISYGFGEIVDHTGPWILLGLAIAALVAPLLDSEWLTGLPWGVDVVLFALLGMPTYVCASAATPLVAILIFKGVSPGAALAFLLAGPATNVTTFGVLAQLHGRRIALAFATAIAGLAIGLGLGVNVLFAGTGVLEPPSLAQHTPTPLEMASLVALTFAFAVSILRQGPRAFVGQVISPYDDGDHCHDHCHDDDGGGHAH